MKDHPAADSKRQLSNFLALVLEIQTGPAHTRPSGEGPLIIIPIDRSARSSAFIGTGSGGGGWQFNPIGEEFFEPIQLTTEGSGSGPSLGQRHSSAPAAQGISHFRSSAFNLFRRRRRRRQWRRRHLLELTLVRA